MIKFHNMKYHAMKIRPLSLITAAALLMALPLNGVSARAEEAPDILYSDEDGVKDLSEAPCAVESPVAEVITDTSGTGSFIALTSSFSILQAEKYDNLDEEPVLSGGEVRFLANLGSSAQQLSAVFKSSDGSVIVVDGGQEADTEHLVNVIKGAGGHVDAWLITHPQTDHVGALYGILSSGRKDISIGSIYYNFFEQEWYDEHDADESGMVYNIRNILSELDNIRTVSDAGRGDEVILSDKLSFRVLNDPLKTEGIFAGNGSGLMYDISMDGKHFIILGDMSRTAGDIHMAEGVLDDIVCDYVQISHHGQTGVSNNFYAALDPKYCIWPTNEYIYNTTGVENSGLGTNRTKLCISKLNVKSNYVTLGRDVIIR